MPDPTENRAPVQAVHPTDKEVLDVLASAMAALKSCYDVATWPADGQTRQDGAIERAATLHARLSQSTEAVQPAFNPAWSDYTEAGSGFNEARDRLTGRLSRNSGVDWINVPKRDLEAVLRYQTAPSVSSEEGNDTEVAGLRVMTGADVLRVFRPLPEDELAALREVMPEIFGDADAGPDEGRAGDDIPTDEQLENRLLCWARKADRDSEWDHVASDLRLAAQRISRTSSDGERCASGDRFKLANRMRGMFDMSKKSADDFNHLSPAGFRLLQQIHDTLSAATAQEAEETGGWRDVLAERRRQIVEEGWTLDHDDRTELGNLALAGACYALIGSGHIADGGPPPYWPWHPGWWKPKDCRRDLVRAAALIIAEIDKGDRASPPDREGER